MKNNNENCRIGGGEKLRIDRWNQEVSFNNEKELLEALY